MSAFEIGAFLGTATAQTLVTLLLWRLTGRKRALLPPVVGALVVQGVNALNDGWSAGLAMNTVTIAAALAVALAIHMRRKAAEQKPG